VLHPLAYSAHPLAYSAMYRVLSALLTVVLVSGAAIFSSGVKTDDKPKNVIFFIADGCGPASFGLAREYQREVNGIPKLDLDAFQSGSVITFADSSRITDSAASATAYACAIKTYNGAIGMDPNREPVETVLEMAEKAGYNTGIVSTASITHATPAAFSSHVLQRGMQNEIAIQQLTKGIEIILGGGRGFYTSPEVGGFRPDSLDLIQRAIDAGYNNVNDRSELMAATEMPVIGLFTASHMAYEIDRDKAQEPSIAEMTAKAVELLSASDKPYFIMIEAGRIDHAGHGNDPAAHIHDVLAYDQAWDVAVEMAREDGETLVIGTSDHETGGLTLGAQFYDGRLSGYAYDPTGYAGASSSIERYRSDLPWLDGKKILPSVGQLADDMVELFGANRDSAVKEAHDWGEARYQKGDSLAYLDLHWSISRAASASGRVGWSTGGHTAVNVPLFAFGPGAEGFSGVMDNTEVGEEIRAVLGLD